MVYGDHGRRVLAPMSAMQRVAAFPWSRLYKHSMYFRALSFVGLGTLSAWMYIAVSGTDVWFTPYAAVHHSIAHSYAHDLDHKRYPIEHHDDKKKH